MGAFVAVANHPVQFMSPPQGGIITGSQVWMVADFVPGIVTMHAAYDCVVGDGWSCGALALSAVPVAGVMARDGLRVARMARDASTVVHTTTDAAEDGLTVAGERATSMVLND